MSRRMFLRTCALRVRIPGRRRRELDGAEAGSATAARTGAARSGDALTTFTAFLSALRPANGDRRDPAYIAGWATEVDIAAIGDFRSVAALHAVGVTGRANFA